MAQSKVEFSHLTLLLFKHRLHKENSVKSGFEKQMVVAASAHILVIPKWAERTSRAAWLFLPHLPQASSYPVLFINHTLYSL